MDWQLHPIDTFEQHKECWDQLNSSNGNTPLLNSRFVEPLISNFGTNRETLAICSSNGVICCMTILAKTGVGSWQTFQPSQAPLGCWIQSTSTPTEQLGRTLREALPGAWLILGITQQDPYLVPRPEHSGAANTIDYIRTARVAVAGSFEDYWAKRGKNLRQNLRRQKNRLAREDVNVKLLAICDPDSMKQAVEQYGILESAGWKSEANTAIHIENSQGIFYSSMLQAFAELNQSIVFQYFYNDHLVATDLCILGGDSLIILKTTYDENITTSSPAMLMREDAFKYIFSEHLVENIEFYGKVMEWHTRWTDDIRTMYHINIYSGIGLAVNKLRNRNTAGNQNTGQTKSTVKELER